MKKLLLISLILTGCAGDNIFLPISSQETIRNQKCEKAVEEIEIFQVIESGALAFVCEEESYSDCGVGLTVFIPTQDGEDYYDGKKVAAPKGQCIGYDGVFQYISKDDRNRTIPKIKFFDAKVPNPEYKKPQ